MDRWNSGSHCYMDTLPPKANAYGCLFIYLLKGFHLCRKKAERLDKQKQKNQGQGQNKHWEHGFEKTWERDFAVQKKSLEQCIKVYSLSTSPSPTFSFTILFFFLMVPGKKRQL